MFNFTISQLQIYLHYLQLHQSSRGPTTKIKVSNSQTSYSTDVIFCRFYIYLFLINPKFIETYIVKLNGIHTAENIKILY